jgi:hypothetical protein
LTHRNILILSILILLLFPEYSKAIYKYAGTSGASFLKIGVSAKLSAMANTSVALDGDINTLNYNPGGISFLRKPHFGSTYNLWFQEIKHSYISIATPIKNNFILGGSIIYLKVGDIRKTNYLYPYGSPTLGNFNAFSIAFTLNTAIRYNKYLGMGINLKLIREKIDIYESNKAFAFDIGALFKLSPINFGVAVLNIGQKIKFLEKEDPLPLIYKIGLSTKIFKENMSLALQLSKPKDNILNYHFGIEYNLGNLAFRVGYLVGSKKLEDNLTWGVGINLFNFSLDYAFITFVDLGKTHKISFTSSF